MKKQKKTEPAKEWSEPEKNAANQRFQQNKNQFKKFGQGPKQGGNMPRALGGHR